MKNYFSGSPVSFDVQADISEFGMSAKILDEYGVSPWNAAVKRCSDVIGALAGLIIGSPIFLIVFIMIKMEDSGSVIFRQERVGYRGRLFTIYKFRSMVADADDVEKYLNADQLAEWRRERKVTDDPRITPLGRVLRRTSLDELPQLLNVLKGDMSLIGPRAITFDELPEYGADAALLLSVPQGVTGAWQAGPRNDATFENGERQAIELEYARNAGFREDVRVFLSTFGAMFARRSGR